MPETVKPSTRRARNSLTLDSILDAAEAVAATGIESLTIRAVAAKLEASPMGLYRYFSTKDELVDALLNRVLGRFVPPDESDDWVADLRVFAGNHYAMLVSQAWAIAPLIGHPNPGANALPIGESALRILARAGVAGEDAVVAFSAVIALNYGWASFAAARPHGEGADVDPAPGRSTDLPGETLSEFPLTAQVATALGRYGSDAHYERALDQLLRGIKAGAAGE